MILVVFDIDGTLTDSQADDDRLYREALQEVTGIDVPVEPWENFGEVTDPAIVRTFIARSCGRPAREVDVLAVRRSFLRKWQEQIESGALTVRPIPGAREIIEQAQNRKGCKVALATGGWGPTALLKLEAAQFPVDRMVIATADDSEIRVQILRTAAIFAAAGAAVPGFSQIVLVGDGVWDARTARQATAGFVGIARDEEHRLRLASEGAAATVPDYLSPDAFWEAVDVAVRRAGSARGN